MPDEKTSTAPKPLPQNFRVSRIKESDRWIDLNRRQQFGPECSQHDWKRYDFDGRAIRPGPATMQPLLSSEVASYYVPLKIRRPSKPVRVGKAIVHAFTGMLFGDERWPQMLCSGDKDTQDYAEALCEEGALRSVMIEARDMAGSVGSVGISWAFKEGKPRNKVHNTKNLWVHEWKDRDRLIPKWISEVYLSPRDEYDPQKQRFVRNWYWNRKDWDEDTETGYTPVLKKGNEEPEWVVEPDATAEHKFGFCPFVWIQNLPAEDDPDGSPDYHGLYDQMDSLDVISSCVGRGAILNCDPTLVLKYDQMSGIGAQGGSVMKGSDHALSVGKDGDAEYLELAGTGIDAGLKVKADTKKDILEQAECVLPDPEQLAAAGTSSVAIKAIYQQMISKAGVLRERWGPPGVCRLIEQQLSVAQERVGRSRTVPVAADVGAASASQEPSENQSAASGEGDETETVEEVDVLDLPPKLVQEPIKDDDGIETGEFTTHEEPLKPGKGKRIKAGWGEWFPLTPADRLAAVTAISTASGGAKVVSQQSAVEEIASVFNREPGEEWARIKTAQKVDDDKQADMFKETGGLVPPPMGDNKFGAKPPPFGGKPGGSPFGAKAAGPPGAKTEKPAAE